MPMDDETLHRAQQEALAFLAAIDALQLRFSSDDYFRRMHRIVGFKETAAVRRASMTLTRALADVRRAG